MLRSKARNMFNSISQQHSTAVLSKMLSPDTSKSVLFSWNSFRKFGCLTVQEYCIALKCSKPVPSLKCWMLFCCHYNSMLTPINTTMHRSAFCQSSFWWIYYWRNSSISTGKETGKTHLCAMFRDQFLCLTKVSDQNISIYFLLRVAIWKEKRQPGRIYFQIETLEK